MRKFWTSIIVIILTITVIPIIIDIAPPVASETIWYVDDIPGGSPSEDFTSIQEAVDAAQPGDTVFVWNGTYYEDVEIIKTLNLTGESRDSTIINGSGTGWCVYGHDADYINITGFTMENGSTGLSLAFSNNSLVSNNNIINTGYGIILDYSNNSTVDSNIILSSFNVGIEISTSSYNRITNNTSSNEGHGIRLFSYSNNNLVSGNQVISNLRGIYLIVWSDENIVKDNIIEGNSQYGIAISNSNLNIFENNSLSNNQVGIRLSMTNGTNLFINSTIISSISNDIEAGSISNDTFLNTTFNKTKSYFYDISSLIEIQWYLHIKVIDYLGNPVPNSQIKIEDSKNSTYQEIFKTDGNGYHRWLTVPEYIERDIDGNTVGDKIYHTPHKLVAWNDTLVGYAMPFMNKSKTITIILYNGTLLDLALGWNLISLPRVQSDINLQTVLQSIDGQCDAVQWYNLTDINDPWKHHHILKPAYLNDLKEINHTMGFWIHVTDPGGTTLVVFGDVLTVAQNITLYPGWNLVGYPSKSNKTRDIALDNLFYGTDVNSIWTYNATTQNWNELNEAADYFEVGKGYWVHSKVTKVWNVPL